MLTIDVIYAPTTRQISLPRNSDFYGGATADSNSVEISVSGISEDDFSRAISVRVDFAVYIMSENHEALRPFITLAKKNDVWTGVIPKDVLKAAANTKKLPFQLVIIDGSKVINSRNTLTLEVTRSIDAVESVREKYQPYLMLRDDTWEWVSNVTYRAGSVVTYNGFVYVSLIDDNLNNVPPLGGQSDENWMSNRGPMGPQGPPGEKVSAGDMVVRYIGDGFSKDFYVDHGLGTTKVIYSLQKGKKYIDTDVEVAGENTLHVTFSTPPGPNEVTMMIYSGGILKDGTVHIHTQDTPSSVWSITHNLNRSQTICSVADMDGIEIYGEIRNVSDNEIIIYFNTEVTGTAIVR